MSHFPDTIYSTARVFLFKTSQLRVLSGSETSFSYNNKEP